MAAVLLDDADVAAVRAECLASIVQWIPTGSRLVLDVDRGIVDSDRRLLNRLAQKSGFEPDVRGRVDLVMAPWMCRACVVTQILVHA